MTLDPSIRKRTLALYLPTLASGGAERLHIILAPFFQQAGYDVSFVLHRCEGSLVPQVAEGCRIVTFDKGRTLACFLPLLRYLKRERPDVLVANLGHNNLLAILASLVARVPTRIIASHHSSFSLECQVKTHWQYRVLPFLSRLLLRHAHGNVAVSAGVADDLSRATGLPRQAITVIYNAIDFRDFETRRLEKGAHPWFGEAIPVVLGVGRLNREKDFPTLLRAFTLARHQRSLRLVLLGEGPEEPGLRRLASELGVEDDVFFAGFAANPLPFMAGASLLVSSSLFEGFGNVLVEALACGTPVVSTDCPYGPREILQNGTYGRLTPIGDATAMAEAILSTLASPPPTALLQARGREFSAERCVAGYTALFDRLLSSTA